MTIICVYAHLKPRDLTPGFEWKGPFFWRVQSSRGSSQCGQDNWKGEAIDNARRGAVSRWVEVGVGRLGEGFHPKKNRESLWVYKPPLGVGNQMTRWFHRFS